MDYRDTLMWKELNQAPQAIASCIKNNMQVFEQIAKMVDDKNIKSIYAVARGTSDHALIYFKYIMEIMAGIPVTLAAPSVVTLYNGKLNLQNCLVIGCSQSGKAADACEILKRGNANNAITLAITNCENSPMAKLANYHINISAGEEKSVAATKTFTAQLIALISLAAQIAKNTDLFVEIKNLSDKLSGNLSQIDEVSTVFAKQFMDIKDGFVLARGLSYPIALESALKLQETSYISLKGYSMSNFYHGPMAMVNTDTPIIIYAPEYCGTDKRIKKCIFDDECLGIDKMLSLKARVLIITDNTVLCDKYKANCCVGMLPKSDNEFLSIFNFVIYAQMFANKISCLIGRNPDSPRTISKITITK